MGVLVGKERGKHAEWGADYPITIESAAGENTGEAHLAKSVAEAYGARSLFPGETPGVPAGGNCPSAAQTVR